MDDALSGPALLLAAGGVGLLVLRAWRRTNLFIDAFGIPEFYRTMRAAAFLAVMSGLSVPFSLVLVGLDYLFFANTWLSWYLCLLAGTGVAALVIGWFTPLYGMAYITAAHGRYHR